jgi:protein O-mannosyl-transferase
MRNPAANLNFRQFVALSLLAIAVLVVAVYSPGLQGPFVFDDIINITENSAVSDFRFSGDDWAEIARQNRPLAMASFALNRWLATEPDAFPFKLTNLIIHLVNTGLVFWLTYLLLTARGTSRRSNRARTDVDMVLPLIAAALWALHPIQLTSVLYVVQRMTSLSAMCVLAGIIVFLYGRHREARRESHGVALMWTGIVGGTALGFGFKENAALLPLYAAVIEFIFYPSEWHNRNTRRRLLLIYLVPFALLSAAILLWLVWRSEPFDSVYILREFTPIERLLTQTRVLWFYVALIVFPKFSHFALFHDDFVVSTSLFFPWTTTIAVVGLIATVVLAVIGRRRMPVFSFAVLWFLAGHILESSFIGLELAHEHRNYLPSLGPIAGIAYALASFIADRRRRKLAATLGVGIVVVAGFTTNVLARAWAQEQTLASFLLKHHSDSARTHVMLGDLHYLKRNDAFQAVYHYLIASDIARHETAYLIRTVQIASLADAAKTETSEPIGKLKNQEGQTMLLVAQDKRGAQSMRATATLYEVVAERLASQPVHARTAQSLRELTQCIVTLPPCRALLPYASKWHALAIDNGRINNSIRLSLLMQLVHLQIESGNLVEAQRASRTAFVMKPDSIAVVLMEANVQLLMGNIDSAEDLLRELHRRSDPMTANQRDEADKLFAIIRLKRGNKSVR